MRKQDEQKPTADAGSVERVVRPGAEASTLVERLRRNADAWLPTNDHTLEAHNLLTAAADELERLTDCGDAGHAEGRCGNAACLRGA